MDPVIDGVRKYNFLFFHCLLDREQFTLQGLFL